MKSGGILLLLLGILVSLVAFGMDGSVASGSLSRVSNIGLLNTKLMAAVVGSALFVAGAVLIGAAEICARLPAPEVEPTRSAGKGEGEAWRETRSIMRTARIEGARIYFLDDSTMAVDGVDETFADVPDAIAASKRRA